MIHQFIFAAPRPGMTEQQFQDYWLNVHAVKFASKIPQIRKYLIDTRVAQDGESEPLWSGVAEIWLKNEEEQLASLQSEEFLQGARLDEPTWAAFWRTLVLDTTAHVLQPAPTAPAGDGVKLLVLSKRREGLPLEAFRAYALGPHAAHVRDELSGLRGYAQGHVRDGAYGIGEAVLDCVEQLWFAGVEEAQNAQKWLQRETEAGDYRLFAEPRYVRSMLVRENWVIGPEPRDYQPTGKG